MGRHSRPSGRRLVASRTLPVLAGHRFPLVLAAVALIAVTSTHSDIKATVPSPDAAPASASNGVGSDRGAGTPEPTAHPRPPAERQAAVRELRTRRASRTRAHTLALLHAQLPGCSSGVDEDHSNGHIPAHALCALPGGATLRADAARAMALLSSRARRDLGDGVCVGGGYRSYSDQAELYAAKPGLAAPPGSSNHGFGTAVDLCGDAGREGTVTHRWLDAAGQRFGWIHPDWAQPGGSRPEPWHLEYLPKLDRTQSAR